MNPVTPDPAATAPADAGPRSILIVDDTPTHLSLLVDALQGAGFRPFVARSGELALQRLQEVEPDLILLDMRMPGLDGIATCARIQQHPRWREIPVIFMTAVEEPEQKVAAFSAGAVDYVTKPFHVEEVLARIRTHLRLKSLQNQLAGELAWRAETERTLQASLEQAVIVATRGSHVSFMTQRAAVLLGRYFGGAEGPVESLPPELHRLVADAAGGTATFAGASGELHIRALVEAREDGLATLILEERRRPDDYAPLRRLGLSERETEVLFWLSEGKSNAEIGMIIGAATTTVKKHAENLFTKLGLESRSAAMRLALEVLQGH